MEMLWEQKHSFNIEAVSVDQTIISGRLIHPKTIWGDKSVENRTNPR